MARALNTAQPSALRVRNLAVRASDTPLIKALDFSLQRGQMLAVLGRNGSGKSLLLHTLAGLRPVSDGTIELQGTDLSQQSRREIARQLGLLPQDSDPPAQVRVFDWVLGGRFAHGSQWRWPNDEDRRIAMDSLRHVQLDSLAERWLTSLSGGELRRASLATLLTQHAAVMLLDEPTNHLDPRQIAVVMQLARDACVRGAAVVVTLHDPQLALRWADSALLLHGDGRWQYGAATAVLTADNVSALYQTPFVSLHAGGRSLLLQE